MRFVLKIIVLVFFWEKHMKSYQVVENGKPLEKKEYIYFRIWSRLAPYSQAFMRSLPQ